MKGEKNLPNQDYSYTARLSFTIEEEIKFSGQEKLKEFIFTKPILQKDVK